MGDNASGPGRAPHGRASFLGCAYVLGAAGFIGSHLCQRLIDSGFHVVGVDDLSTGVRESVPDGVEFYEADVRHLPIAFASAPPDIIFHLASPASPPKYVNRMFTFESNVNAAIRASTCYNCPVIFASSSEVYGRHAEYVKESQAVWQDEPSARANYANSKLAAETALLASSVPTASLRLFNVYGPGFAKGDGRVIPNFIERIAADAAPIIYGGDQSRAWCYITDTVDALMLTKDMLMGAVDRTIPELLNPPLKLTLNIGNPFENTTIFALSRLVSQKFGCLTCFLEERPPREFDVLERSPNIDRAQRVLGWKPTTSLIDGLRHTIDWYVSEYGRVE